MSASYGTGVQALEGKKEDVDRKKERKKEDKKTERGRDGDIYFANATFLRAYNGRNQKRIKCRPVALLSRWTYLYI